MHQLSLFFFTVETYPVLSWSQVGWWGQRGAEGIPPSNFPLSISRHSSQWSAPIPVSQQTTGQAQTFRGEVVTGSQQNPSGNFLSLHARRGRRHEGHFSRGVHLNTNGSSNRSDKIIDPSRRQKLGWITRFYSVIFLLKIFWVKCVMIHQPTSCIIMRAFKECVVPIHDWAQRWQSTNQAFQLCF